MKEWIFLWYFILDHLCLNFSLRYIYKIFFLIIYSTMYCSCGKVIFRILVYLLSWSKINFKYLNSTRCMFINCNSYLPFQHTGALSTINRQILTLKKIVLYLSYFRHNKQNLPFIFQVVHLENKTYF